jgi:hypothetical protein
MLKIQCTKCNQTLKGKEITITPFHAYINGVKYQDYACTCSKCGGSVVHDRMVRTAEANKAKAMAKLARKAGKSVQKFTEEQQYDAIMRKVGKRAREIAASYKENPITTLQDLSKAIDELPQEERDIVLAHEDKENMELLRVGTKKPTKHIKPASIVLLTQAIIESARDDKDEDFLKYGYGEYVVDAYNTALTNHKHHDYGITAALLLEKMQNGELAPKGEDEDA